MTLRQILSTVIGSKAGLDSLGNWVLNRRDGSQIVLDANATTGVPSVYTQTAAGTAAQYDILTSAQAAAAAAAAGNSTYAATGAPASPAAVQVIAGDASAILIIQPTRTRNATALTVTPSSGPAVTVATSDTAPVTVTVTGLTNAAAVTFNITATNAVGTSAALVSRSITPTARPAHLAGLPVMLWIDSSQITPQSDNTAIGAVPDFSGNGYDGASSGTARPLYRTAANVGGGGTGKPALVFDGDNATGMRLLTGLRMSDLGPEATIFVVAGKGSTVAGTGLNKNNVRDMRLLSAEITRLDKNFSLVLSDTLGSGGNDCFCARYGTGEVNASSVITAGADATGTGAPYVVSLVTGAQMFVDGTLQAPAGAGLPAIPKNPSFLCIGNIQGNQGSAGMAGPVWEVIAIRGRITNTQRWAIELALCTKVAKSAPTQAATL